MYMELEVSVNSHLIMVLLYIYIYSWAFFGCRGVSSHVSAGFNVERLA